MAYESGRLKPVAEYEVFELRLDEGDKQRFSDEPEGFFTELLEEEGAPDPNQVRVHRASDSVNDLINTIVADIESGGSSPPLTAVYHQKSGPHPSRYIVISGFSP